MAIYISGNYVGCSLHQDISAEP